MCIVTRHLFAHIAGVGVALLLVSCATVPETGRSQLVLVSAEQETQLGLTEFEKLKQSTPISQDSEQQALVRNVGERVAAVAPLPNAKWEFVLFEAPETANAFCLPGGKVGIYSGILAITQTEAGLATVVGHEVAHAVARHGAERISQGLIIERAGQTLGEAMKTQPELTKQLALRAYGVGAQFGVILPYSRKQELEADRLGLLYMARAGYDPRESVAFWQRFSAHSQKAGGQPFEFLSTHPLDETRIRDLEAQMPQAMADYEKAAKKR